MQTPVQIDFQGININAASAREMIQKHVSQLEHFFDRITACRVVLKGPGEHHRTGGLYEVNVRLALPDGHEVNISRTPKVDERHSDLEFAINDAFHRARRALQDRRREMEGIVKHHEGRPTGIVMRLDDLGEFGMIEGADGQEIYFHRNSVLGGAFDKIEVGSHVAYSEEAGDKGPQASTVRLLEKPRKR